MKTPSADAVLAELWQMARLRSGALGQTRLTGHEPALPSSFAVGTAAQSSMAAAALAAAEIGRLRQTGAGTGREAALPAAGAWPIAAQAECAPVASNMQHAAMECATHFAIDGQVPELWDKYSGLYRTADGWVRIHANFAHHRDGALAILGLQAGEATSKADVEQALKAWKAEDFEQAAANRGLVVAALRTRAQWLAHPQATAVLAEPLVAWEGIANQTAGKPSNCEPFASALADEVDSENTIINIANNVADIGQSGKMTTFSGFWQRLQAQYAPHNRPLAGLRVLDLTRILAGPVCGRALAAYGADVLMVNSPNLPNISAIADTSRGKRSAFIDLQTQAGRAALRALVAECDVFVQGYRPGGLAALGFGPQDVAALRPGVVYVSLAAYGFSGPWADRRGFDSLVQTATGLNADESAAAELDLTQTAPRALPVQILDHATGYLMAFGALAAVLREREQEAAGVQAPSVHVKLSLARTGEWLRSLGRVSGGLAVAKPSPEPYMATQASGFGQLSAMRHAVSMGGAPCDWPLPAMPPGSHPPAWW